jgi:hypothetical protein
MGRSLPSNVREEVRRSVEYALAELGDGAETPEVHQWIEDRVPRLYDEWSQLTEERSARLALLNRIRTELKLPSGRQRRDAETKSRTAEVAVLGWGLLDLTARDLEAERRGRAAEVAFAVWRSRQSRWLAARTLLSDRLFPAALLLPLALVAGGLALGWLGGGPLEWFAYLVSSVAAVGGMTILAVLTAYASLSEPGPLTPSPE